MGRAVPVPCQSTAMDKRKWSSRALLGATLAAVALVGPSVAARAQAQGETAGTAPAAPATLPVGPRPESTTKGWDGKFFVSIQGAPDLGLNAGQIRTFDPATRATTAFAPGLYIPRG